MIKKLQFKYLKHTKGQALLFVVVAMTVALTVGVAISTRNLSSARRVSRTDTSVRVLAASEGGIEKLLSKSDAELEEIKNSTYTNYEEGWELNYEEGTYTISFDANPDDNITSQAVVSVEERTLGDNVPDVFNLSPGLNKEVVLNESDTDYKICWDAGNAAIYYLSYNSSGDMQKGILWPSGCTECPLNIEPDESAGSIYEVSSGYADYPYCQDITTVPNPYGLRIKVLYNPSDNIAVYPGPDKQLPSQGYNLKSTGQLLQDNSVSVSKLITVYRSYKYLPGFFDYAVYSNTSF